MKKFLLSLCALTALYKPSFASASLLPGDFVALERKVAVVSDILSDGTALVSFELNGLCNFATCIDTYQPESSITRRIEISTAQKIVRVTKTTTGVRLSKDPNDLVAFSKSKKSFLAITNIFSNDYAITRYVSEAEPHPLVNVYLDGKDLVPTVSKYKDVQVGSVIVLEKQIEKLEVFCISADGYAMLLENGSYNRVIYLNKTQYAISQ
jgi:hypothetical protein